MLFSLRFDFRNPPMAGTSMAERYEAALEMVEWADRLGAANVTLSEHHGSPDGYLPSPLPMIAAMAQRTKNIRFVIAAVIAPFHDPLRLAEDIAVVDNLCQGRLDLVIAGGYASHEFAMFDVPMGERPHRVTEVVRTLKAAFSGEPFEYRGRTVQVTPPPFQPGGPTISLGGASEPAARRAARIADGFIPTSPQVWPWYQDEMVKLGKPDPGPCPTGESVTTALAEDAEQGWEQHAPFFLHDINAYTAWGAPHHPPMVDTDVLRGLGRYRVVTPADFVAEQRAAPLPFAVFHPLCGGVPPEQAWETLRLFERDVFPKFN